MSTRRIFRQGAFTFSIGNACHIAQLLHREFSPLSCDDDDNAPLLTVDFTECLPQPILVDIGDGVAVGDGRLLAHRTEAAHFLEHDDDRTHLTWQIVRGRRSFAALPPAIRRLNHPDHQLPAERSAKHFHYQCFDGLSSLLMLALDQILVHASCIAIDGRAILFTGLGGVGKTTLLLSCMKRPNIAFLGDDLSCITADGRAILSPKAMHIYDYNLAGDTDLKQRVIGASGPWGRLHWRWQRCLRSTTQVRRRVFPTDLFGPDRLGSAAVLDTIFFLEKGRKTECLHLASDEMATRMTAAMQHELRYFVSLVARARTAGFRSNILDRFWQRWNSVIRRALTGRTCRLLRIPPGGAEEALPWILAESS